MPLPTQKRNQSSLRKRISISVRVDLLLDGQLLLAKKLKTTSKMQTWMTIQVVRNILTKKKGSRFKMWFKWLTSSINNSHIPTNHQDNANNRKSQSKLKRWSLSLRTSTKPCGNAGPATQSTIWIPSVTNVTRAWKTTPMTPSRIYLSTSRSSSRSKLQKENRLIRAHRMKKTFKMI